MRKAKHPTNPLRRFSLFRSKATGVFCLCLWTFLAAGGEQARADNGVMMQYFHWYLPNDGALWAEVKEQTQSLSDAGVTALWLPPAYKAAGGNNDVGYGVYDMYDLGEFEQKGSIRTKYGTKEAYLQAIDSAHQHGIQVYGDVVFNHRGGAEETEWVTAVRVNSGDRNQEEGGDVRIQAWTKFDFPGRANTYSDFKWRWYHFDATDWAQNLGENRIFKFRGTGKGWDWEVDTENANYDYLLYADLDMDHPDVVQELKDWGQWYIQTTGVDGFRLDAIKHIKFDFFNDWLDHMRAITSQELFTVGEFWSYDKAKLHNYIAKTGGRMSLFDAPLHLNFHRASTSFGHFDMRTLMDNTLMKEQPSLAVTLVDNHDTQPCQALESAVQDWFKPMAYAFILLRQEGYPNLFYADYYGATYTASDNGCDNTPITIASHREAIERLLHARKNYAYGPQIDYLDHWDIIGWTRQGDATHPRAMAVVMTDAAGGHKRMYVGPRHTTFVDITKNRTDKVISNAEGFADFPVNGGSYSVWVEQPSTSVLVTFQCLEGFSTLGQNIYVVGSHPSLGSWNPSEALKLSPLSYPTWSGAISLPPQTEVEWKCIKKEGDRVEWSSNSNQVYHTPSTGTGHTIGSF